MNGDGPGPLDVVHEAPDSLKAPPQSIKSSQSLPGLTAAQKGKQRAFSLDKPNKQREGSNDTALASSRASARMPSTTSGGDNDDPGSRLFFRTDSAFRGPLDFGTPVTTPAAKGKGRTSWLGGVTGDQESFFRRWVEEPLGLAETPEGHTPGEDHPKSGQSTPKVNRSRAPSTRRASGISPQSESSEGPATWDTTVRKLGLKKHSSLPHIRDAAAEDHEHSVIPEEDVQAQSSNPPQGPRMASRRWGLIRNRFGPTKGSNSITEPVAAVPTDLNITDELMAGGLAAVMLGMHFERDEQDRRRVPILLHHLKIRVSDSIHPLSGSHAVFRIECEYANGASRWVIYRELRDFVSLHTHYRVAKVYNRGDIELPEFPLTSLPYFKIFKSQNPHAPSSERRASFARLQRLHLENYLLALIRCVMFKPESNRLARFFELSALSVSLAKSGGIQGKAGLLRVIGGETSRKSVMNSNWGKALLGLGNATKPRWWIVRESYLVAVDDPESTTIYDVFLLDQDFEIERPKRYYRKLDVIHPHDEENLDENGNPIASPSSSSSSSSDSEDEGHPREGEKRRRSASVSSKFGKGTFSRLAARLHFAPASPANPNEKQLETNGTVNEKPANETTHQDFQPNVDPSIAADPHQIGQAMETPKDESLDPNGEISGKTVKKKKFGIGKGKSMDVSQHTFYIQNSQRRLRLMAPNERQLHQWIASMERVTSKTHWHGTNRFDSFAPIRLNVAAQWLVDGRDYFWNLSRAISLAKETIYIHDWWLSPELQLRRPHKNHYRIDNLLKRKAEEGVKIFVIVYKEVSNRTTPTDSNYTKQRLVSLHPNIMVQRSPSHFATGTFYWAHHEKMCVIDEAIAFMGGLDMCFGRWDTPQHSLVDDPDDPNDQIWPGKDYANERVVEFHTLSKPEQDMYDRGKVPRMPWHDVALQMLGQPARDLCRHFVQRQVSKTWNYLLRVKNHSRVMPFLLPPAEFSVQQLEQEQLLGTCEIQICRSAGNWSMGFQHRVEHSIQNAYLKAIQMSEHFVYIENQFFITSTVINDVVVENKIGDALVSRIIRAHHEGTKWKACIVIPLLPGFTFPIDHNDASAVRIILECQNRTISRGPHSIFARLRKEGIDPNEYITFFSLRTWGKLRGDVLTTEMVYIHGKCMIVDDRLAIIGSANINERSQRGDRDSELASVIRDTDMIDSTMAGKPFKVGRFAHTLRIRLMREHLGVDVDTMYDEDLMAKEPSHPKEDVKPWDPDQEEGTSYDRNKVSTTGTVSRFEATAKDTFTQVIHGTDDDVTGDLGKASRKLGMAGSNIDSTANDETIEADRHMVGRDGETKEGFPGSIVPTLEEQTVAERRPSRTEGSDRPIMEELDKPQHHTSNERGRPSLTVPPEARLHDGSNELFGVPASASRSRTSDDETPRGHGEKPDADEEEQAAIPARKILRQHLAANVDKKPWALPIPTPAVDPYGFEDPVCDEFFKDVWVASATHNTEVYRKVFHCTPDDLVTTWKQYKEFVQHQERLSKPPKDAPANTKPEPVARVPSEGGGPTRDGDSAPIQQGQGDNNLSSPTRRSDASTSSTRGETSQPPNESNERLRPSNVTSEDGVPLSPGGASLGRSTGGGSINRGRRDDRDGLGAGGGSTRRKPPQLSEPLEQWEKDEMEEMLSELRGHLVVYPTRFLEGEDLSNNFLFNADRLLPLPIYD